MNYWTMRDPAASAPSWAQVARVLPPHAETPRSEAALVRNLVSALRNDWSPVAMSTEAGTHGRSRIDIALVTAPPSEWLVGIEAKLHNWERAIQQASLNRYVVDLSYIALPVMAVSPSVVRRAHEEGVGIIAVAEKDARVVLGSMLNRPDPLLRSRLVSQMRRVRRRPNLMSTEAETQGGRIGA